MDIDLVRALARCLERPSERHLSLAEALDLGPPPTPADHTHALVFSLCPYASVYLDSAGRIGGRARQSMAELHRRVGTPLVEPDHIGALLTTWAAIRAALDEQPDPSRRAQVEALERELFWEHLASFLPAYTSAMRELGIEFYARWAELLSGVIREEAERIGPADALPAHFAHASPFSECSSRDELPLLSPVRTGMILVRGDFLDRAREYGIDVTISDRSGLLSELLSVNAGETLGWLTERAWDWAERHRAESFGIISEEWATRAASTADALEMLVTGEESGGQRMNGTISLIDIAQEVFTAEDWSFTVAVGAPALRIPFEGENARFVCFAQTQEEQRRFIFCSIYPAAVETHRRAAVAEFLMRVNMLLVVGNFEIDFDTGEVRCRTSIDVEDAELTAALLKNLALANVVAMDNYSLGIEAVLNGTTPEVALGLCNV